MIVVLITRNWDLFFLVSPIDISDVFSRNITIIVTIFFSDIVGFTTMCGEMRPVQVMRMLNELYTELDKLVAKHKIYKVETIG